VNAVEWLDSLSPWPRDGFGVERMRALLAQLGNPQDGYPAIHVVGTNGKSTATVTIEQLLLSEGLSVGSTISPHVASWNERIRIDGAEADFEAVLHVATHADDRLVAAQKQRLERALEAARRRGRPRRRRSGSRRAA
jgi:dihydrofolate synthase/folylpolyglutamate synthase